MNKITHHVIARRSLLKRIKEAEFMLKKNQVMTGNVDELFAALNNESDDYKTNSLGTSDLIKSSQIKLG